MTNRMADIVSLARIQLLFMLLFVFFKLIRPFVLNGDSAELFKLALLSLPNFFEAVIGTLILTGIGLVLRDKIGDNRGSLQLVYLTAVLLAAVYVIAQELGFHNLGGNNVTDINDVLFSIIGLLVGYAIILRKQPRIQTAA